MFGNLLGDMQGKQEEMKARLATEILEVEVSDGAIKVKINANREIVDISIDREKIDLTESDELEDLLVIAINQALEIAAEREAAEAQNMIKDMIPPGLGGLFGMKS